MSEPRDLAFWQAKAAIARTFAKRPAPPPSGRTDTLCRVADRLFLSSCYVEQDKELLRKHGITHILQVGHELSASHPSTEFSYLHVDVMDLEEEDLLAHLPACFEFIEQARAAGAVLVHCAAGISRSASVCIAYLMARQQLPYAAAKAAVKAARPLIAPNEGFGYQLEAFGEAGCSAEGWQPWTLDRFMEERARRGRAFAAQRPVDDGSSMSDGDWGQAYQSYGAMVSSYGKRT